jgi:hypothetical protein
MDCSELMVSCRVETPQPRLSRHAGICCVRRRDFHPNSGLDSARRLRRLPCTFLWCRRVLAAFPQVAMSHQTRCPPFDESRNSQPQRSPRHTRARSGGRRRSNSIESPIKESRIKSRPLRSMLTRASMRLSEYSRRMRPCASCHITPISSSTASGTRLPAKAAT